MFNVVTHVHPTPGEYASGSGHKHVVEQLLDFAVQSELLLNAASRNTPGNAPASTSTPADGEPTKPYLEQRLTFRDGAILDEQVLYAVSFVCVVYFSLCLHDHCRASVHSHHHIMVNTLPG